MGERDRQRPWMGLAGAGFEIAAAVGGFAALGWWIDRQRGSAPWGLLIGALLGLAGGLYNLIRAALRTSRQAEAVRAAEAVQAAQGDRAAQAERTAGGTEREDGR